MFLSDEEIGAWIEENQKLIYYALRPYRNVVSPRFDQGDLVQVANLAVLRANETFDGESSKFSSYAYNYILWDVKKFLRKNAHVLSTSEHTPYDSLPKVASLDARESRGEYDDQTDGTLGSITGRPDKEINFMMLMDAVERVCNRLRDGARTFEMWKLWRLGGYEHKEIASLYGSTRSAVGMRLNKLERLLKEEYPI